MQRYGSGFEKILEEYKPYEKEFQPKITSEQSWFTITLMDVAYTNKESLVNSTLQLPKCKILYITQSWVNLASISRKSVRLQI